MQAQEEMNEDQEMNEGEADEDEGENGEEGARGASCNSRGRGKFNLKSWRRRRRKTSYLSRQPNRRMTPGADVTWMRNTPNNLKILDQKRQQELERKR